MEGDVISTTTNTNYKHNPLPWKTRLTLRLISVINSVSCRRDGTVNRTIYNFFNPKASPSLSPVHGVYSSDVIVDPNRNLWFRLFVPKTPPQSKPLPVVVLYHGGGFAFLSANSKVYDEVCRRFARKIPAVVVSVEYRLAPEHRYPAQFEDGFDVLKFLDGQKQGEMLPENVNLGHCFLAGDSAGANIAHHVAVRAASAQSSFSTLKVVALPNFVGCSITEHGVLVWSHALGPVYFFFPTCRFNGSGLVAAEVIGVVSIQPFFGGEERTDAELRMTQLVTIERTDWLWKTFISDKEYHEKGGRDHPAINVSGPRAADISGLDSFPPTIVFVGGLDALQDWQRRYYHWLLKSGKKASLVEYPTMCHAFYVFPYLPESGRLISQVAEFVSSLTPE